MTSHELPPPNIIITGNPKAVTITTSFGFGCGGHLVTTEEYLSEENFNYPYKKSIATAGILRGSGECVKKAEEFWYIDHGYFHRTKHPPDCDGYYRVGHNTLWSSGEGDYTWDRFNSFKIELKPWRKDGSHIIVVPPSRYMCTFLNRVWWLEKTQRELSKYTKRKIIVSTKDGVKLRDCLPGAWALVTDHSNAAVDAVIHGVPVIVTHPDRRIGSLEEIENPPKSRGFLKNLANRQWTLEEMRSGMAWDEIKNYHKYDREYYKW